MRVYAHTSADRDMRQFVRFRGVAYHATPEAVRTFFAPLQVHFAPLRVVRE